MRWAWRDAIRFKDWKKLEEYAKTQPCGQLADTLYELQIGLDDKEDVRAAKKVLYILEQQGIHPSQTEGPRIVKYQPATAAKFGVLGTSDHLGFQYYALVHTCGRKVRVISGNIHHEGYCQLNAFEVPFGQFHRLRGKVMLAGVPGVKAYVLSPEYMLNRLAFYREHFGFFNLETMKRDWEPPAYWTGQLEGRPDRFPSLSDGVSPISAGSIDIEKFWQENEQTRTWRFPINEGRTPSVMPELRRIEAKVRDPQERYEMRLKCLQENRHVVVHQNSPFEYEVRFCDMATFALLDDDEPTAKKFKRMEYDIGQKGAKSRFFDSLIEATARDLERAAGAALVDMKHYLFHPAASIA